MSTLLLIAAAEKRPTDPQQNTVVHQALLDGLNQVATADGWAGSAIETYVKYDNYFSITIKPADRPATIFDLRRFREEQKQLEEQLAEQGRFF